MRSLSKIVATGIVVAVLSLAIVGSVILSGETTIREKGLWSDATDVLSNKYVVEAGRAARKPFINTEQGNLLLFVFALGGVGGGFTVGYYWRRLMKEKAER